VEGTRARCRPYADVRVVSWIGGNAGVHMAHQGALVYCAYPATHAHAGSAMHGPRRHAFSCVSSASGTGCARLHRRAPGAVSHLAQRW
jgi:hypothetical protein